MRNTRIRTVGSRSGPVNGGHVTIRDLPGITDFSDISGHTGRISQAECGQNRTNRVGQRRGGRRGFLPRRLCVLRSAPRCTTGTDPAAHGHSRRSTPRPGNRTLRSECRRDPSGPLRGGVGAFAGRPHSSAPSPAGARSSRVPDRCPARTLHVHRMCTRRSCRASSVRVRATAVVGRRSPGRAGHAGLAGTGGEERP
jgi:hypothetical protein